MYFGIRDWINFGIGISGSGLTFFRDRDFGIVGIVIFSGSGFRDYRDRKSRDLRVFRDRDRDPTLLRSRLRSSHWSSSSYYKVRGRKKDCTRTSTKYEAIFTTFFVTKFLTKSEIFASAPIGASASKYNY